jgi:hypothetical protein
MIIARLSYNLSAIYEREGFPTDFEAPSAVALGGAAQCTRCMLPPVCSIHPLATYCGVGEEPGWHSFWVRVVKDRTHPYFDPSDSNIALMFKLLASPDPRVFPAKPHPPQKLVLTQFCTCAFANNGAEYWKVLDLLDLHPVEYDGWVRWYTVQVIQDGYPYRLESDAECYVCFILWLYQAGINSLTWACIVSQTVARESAREARCNYRHLSFSTVPHDFTTISKAMLVSLHSKGRTDLERQVPIPVPCALR